MNYKIMEVGNSRANQLRRFAVKTRESDKSHREAGDKEHKRSNKRDLVLIKPQKREQKNIKSKPQATARRTAN